MSQPQAQPIPISIETLWHGNLQALSEPTLRENSLTYLLQEFLNGCQGHFLRWPPQSLLCVLVCLGRGLFSVSFISLCQEEPFHPFPALLRHLSLPIVNQESVSSPSKFSPPSLGQSTESCPHISGSGSTLHYVYSTPPSLLLLLTCKGLQEIFQL